MKQAYKHVIKPILFVSFFTCLSFHAKAQEPSYPSGSIGFLYQQCKSAIQKESVEAFSKSWCGVFLHSYRGGYSNAVWKTLGKEDLNEYAPECLEAINSETRYKENKFRCRAQELGLINGLSVFEILEYFFTWVEWLEVAEPDMLSKPIVPHVNLISRQGDFCDSLGDTPPKARDFEISQDIYNDIPNMTPEILSSYNMTQKEIYDSCKNLTDSTSDEFYTSLCGAYNVGFMAGMHVTDFTLNRTVSYPGCENEIAKYYKFEIAAKELCLPTDTYDAFTKTFKYSSYDEKTGQIVSIKKIDLCSGEHLF